jgi:hypothetical protein
MVAWCAVPTVIAVCAEHRHKLWESFADDAPCVCHLLLRGFSVLVAHNDVTRERLPTSDRATRHGDYNSSAMPVFAAR